MKDKEFIQKLNILAEELSPDENSEEITMNAVFEKLSVNKQTNSGFLKFVSTVFFSPQFLMVLVLISIGFSVFSFGYNTFSKKGNYSAELSQNPMMQASTNNTEKALNSMDDASIMNYETSMGSANSSNTNYGNEYANIKIFSKNPAKTVEEISEIINLNSGNIVELTQNRNNSIIYNSASISNLENIINNLSRFDIETKTIRETQNQMSQRQLTNELNNFNSLIEDTQRQIETNNESDIVSLNTQINDLNSQKELVENEIRLIDNTQEEAYLKIEIVKKDGMNLFVLVFALSFISITAIISAVIFIKVSNSKDSLK